MNRLVTLQQWIKDRPDDPLVMHALALEWVHLADYESALTQWLVLRRSKPDYLPLYYHSAIAARETGNDDLCKTLLQEGIALARIQNDSQTEKELVFLQASSNE